MPYLFIQKKLIMALLNPLHTGNKALFEGLQGNILKGHGRDHTANIFIHCRAGRQAAFRQWIHRLVTDGIITSLYKQLRDNYRFKDNGIDGELFGCIFLTAEGYQYVEGATQNFEQKFSQFEASFTAGMAAAQLNDPPTTDWEAGFADTAKPVHCMLLLAHDNRQDLERMVTNIQSAIETFGSITLVQNGDVLRNEEGAGIEHFGYVDGVSQPLFFEEEMDAYVKANNIDPDTVDSGLTKITNKNKKNSTTQKEPMVFDPRAEKELVLTKDPFADDAFGSYFVFRKLEQDVRGFKAAEEELAAAIGLHGDDAERAGALLVGRFEDGTPIELSGEDGMIRSYLQNNFNYDKADMSRCPFHAHIRKSNPRAGNPTETSAKKAATASKQHTMARRGIPYGSRPDGIHAPNFPSAGVGLLFMSYQASLTDQFEFIQKNWVDSPTFPNTDSGTDPIIGQTDSSDGRDGDYAEVWGDANTIQRHRFDQFVTLKGGAYFFAPSMVYLENII